MNTHCQHPVGSVTALLYLVHLPDERVDFVLPVTQITSFHEMLELPGLKPAVGTVELERPEEVGGLFEVRPYCED